MTRTWLNKVVPLVTMAGIEVYIYKHKTITNILNTKSASSFDLFRCADTPDNEERDRPKRRKLVESKGTVGRV